MNKLKIKYIDSILNSNYGSLDMASKHAEIWFSDDEIFFKSSEKNIDIKEIIDIKPVVLSGYRVNNWLQLDYVKAGGKKETTYISRRSFYNPSVKKIEQTIQSLIKDSPILVATVE